MNKMHSMLKIEEIPEKGGYDIESAGSAEDLLTLWTMLSISISNRLNVPKKFPSQLLTGLPPSFSQEFIGNRAWCIKMPMPLKEKGGSN